MLLFTENFLFDSSESDFSISRIDRLYKASLNRIEYAEKDGYTYFISTSYTNEVGFPQIPILRITVYSNSPDVKIKNLKLSNEKIINLSKEIFPSQYPHVKQNDDFVFAKEDKFYSSFSKYPAMTNRVIYAGEENGIHINLIEIYPLIYKAGVNELAFYRDIEFEMDGEILNDLPEWESFPSKYLIVTKNEFLPSLSVFTDFKKRQGFSVEILDIDTTGSVNTDIKNHIQSLYDTSSVPLRFILLAGDVNLIPNFVGTEMDSPPTDLYYSLLAGSDYIPDVYIGRFPSSDTAYLRIISEKTVMFETAAWNAEDEWSFRAYLMASDDPSFHLVAESTQVYAAGKLRSMSMTVDSMFDYYSSGTPVSTAINNGRSIAAYSGHGSYTAWAGPSFSQTDIGNLLNQDMIPFVSSYACQTGNYALSYDCFGETWVKKENGGAVSFMGSSVYSYWDEDDYMERAFFDALADSGIFFTGKLMNIGKFGVYSAYSGGGLSKRYYEMYNILGDPSLSLYTGIEDTLKINVLNPIPEASTEIEIEVKGDGSSMPVANALVSVMLNNTLFYAGYTDSSGLLKVTNPGFSGETIRFVATKPNFRYGETFSTVSSSSFYPYISNVLFADTIFFINPPDSQYSPLDTGDLSIMIENLGENIIVSLTCSLSTVKSLIGFKSRSLAFQDTLSVGDSSWALMPVVSFANEGIKNNARDTIVFSFKDINDSTALFKKQVKILAPEIKVISADYDVSDGIVSGDTVKMSVKAANLSNINDYSVSMQFISNDTLLLKFIDSVSGLPYIQGYDTLASDTLTFYVKSGIDSFFSVSYRVCVEDTFGIKDTFEFSLNVNKLDYLVLDRSKNNLSAIMIDSLLTDLGYNGEYALSVNKLELDDYKNIFLCAGEYPNNNAISAGDSIPAAIDSLCKEGKLNLYLEGGEVWYWDIYTGNGYDFGSLFKIDGKNDGDMANNFEIVGLSGSIAEGMNMTYSGGISADVLDTLYGAKNVFLKGDTVYAVSNSAPLYRTVGSSLGVGSLADADSISSKREWVRRIMLFFEGAIGINDLNIALPLPEFKFISMNSTLSSSEFRIFFSALKEENVTFRIYNSAGMEVFSKKITAGSSGLNLFVFNPSSEKLSSGVYFIRADNSKKSFTKKIAVIR